MAKPAHGAMKGARAQHNLTTQQFVRAAAEGGMFEVESSQIALQKSQNADVKTFAQRMIDDHGKANDQLKNLAGQNQLRVPASLDKRDAAKIAALQKASGASFDTAYLRDQRVAHHLAIRLFQGYAENGDQPAVKDWAKSTLPTLEEHQKMLKDMKKAP
jgi:putative membrane protein